METKISEPRMFLTKAMKATNTLDIKLSSDFRYTEQYQCMHERCELLTLNLGEEKIKLQIPLVFQSYVVGNN